MTHALPNMERIGCSLYVVRTQAGFKKVTNLYQSDMSDKDPVEGYPVSYPSFVTISRGYRGYHYLQADCWPVGLIADACKRHTPESPEEEGTRIAREGHAPSALHALVSEINLDKYDHVLDAYVAERKRLVGMLPC